MNRPSLHDRVRGLLLVSTAMVVSMAAAWAAVRGLDDAADPPRLVALPGPPGLALNIDAEPGIRPMRLGPNRFIAIVGAQPVHETTVSLCDQVTNPAWKNDRSRMLKLHGGVSWGEVKAMAAANLAAGRRAHDGIKNPLLDDPAWDAPRFWVHTSRAIAPLDEFPAPTDPSVSRLRLHTFEPGRSLLISDVPTGNDSRIAPDVLFHSRAWLLWQSADLTGASFADRAVQVRRIAREGCRYGALRFRAWSVDVSPHTDHALLIGMDSAIQGSWRIPAGVQLSIGTPDRGEAGELFIALQAAGLVAHLESGALTLAPRDAGTVRFVQSEDPSLVVEPGGFPIDDDSDRELLGRVHGTPAGAAVRAAIKRFNAQRLLAAIRFQRGLPDRYHVTVAQYTAPRVDDLMPDRAGALFDAVPTNWSPWVRVAQWNADDDAHTPVRFGWSVRARERRTLVVIGSGIDVKGPVKVIESKPLCVPGPCGKGDVPIAHRLTIEAGSDGDAFITIHPWPRSEQAYLFAHERPEIVTEDGAVHWRATSFGHTAEPPQVSLTDRHGAPLLSIASGGTLDPLFSATKQLGQSLPETIARLLQGRREHVEARLSIDARLQTQAREALAAGMARASAAYRKGSDPYRDERFGALLLLDPENGDILAAASAPEIDSAADPTDLRAHAETHPAQTPRLLRTWQHTGRPLTPAASTFKLVVALSLEQAARRNPELARELAGLDEAALRQAGHRHGLAFDPAAVCYPADAKTCDWAGARRTRSGGSIENYVDGSYQETASQQMLKLKEARYGLEQAIRDSLNTVFAWWLEGSDLSLLDDGAEPGLPGLQMLTTGALDVPRPWYAMARRLGFESALRLDAGLLAGIDTDVLGTLAATPSRIDPIRHRQDVRMAALGARMQVTPLQMAMVAASIAEGRVVRPRLLLELDGDEADTPEFESLDVPLERIRRGMKRVVVDGTAKRTFNPAPNAEPNAPYRYLRDAVYGKTGTLALRETPGAGPNAVWFVGWLEPGIVPGLDKRMAFACLISHSARTGGRECAPVVAELLHRVATAKAEAAS